MLCVWSMCVCAVCTASCLGVSLCFAIRLAKFAIKRNSMSLAYNWQSPSQRQTRERGKESTTDDEKIQRYISAGRTNVPRPSCCSRGKSFA